MEEFALCWKNFQDNIADGFHRLFLRGDLVDVTLACDGKLLRAHKVVLSICSPYFQEIFRTTPCEHPIIILKDVSYGVMQDLLQFMYQGVVNVKQDDLPTFMKIAASLQIKGLTAHEEPQNGKYNNVGPANNTQKYVPPAMTTPAGPGAAVKRSPDRIPHEPYPIIKRRNPQQPPNFMAELIHQVQNQQHHITQQQHEHRTAEGDLSSEETSSMNHSSSLTEDVLMPAISLMESPAVFPMVPGGNIGGVSGHTVKRESVESPSVDTRSCGSHQTSSNGGSGDRPLFNPPLKLEFGQVTPDPAAVAAMGFQMTPNRSTNMSTSSSPGSHSNDMGEFSRSMNHMEIPTVTPGEKWVRGKLEFMLSQRGKPLLVHDGYTFGIQYIRKDKKYWQCNLSRKFNCKARVTTTQSGDIIVTNNEHCHTEIRQHLRKEYKMNRLQNMSQSLLQQHALQLNLNRLAEAQRQVQQQQQQQNQSLLDPSNVPVNLNASNNLSILPKPMNNNHIINHDQEKNDQNNNNSNGDEIHPRSSHEDTLENSARD